MIVPELLKSIAEFTAITQNLPDEALDIAWGWRDYSGEGIRFAFLRTFEELQELGIRLQEERGRNNPFTRAQHALGQYHNAYWNLQAACLGVSDEIAVRPPATSAEGMHEEEWDIRRALSHILGADLGFYGVITFALEKHRAGVWSPEEKITDPDWDRLLGLTEEEYNALLKSPFLELESAHAVWHDRILQEFADITQAECELPSRFWEKDPYPIHFRLGRFSSHMTQHTIQIRKTLEKIRAPRSEARRLLGVIYGALAGVGAATIGAWDLGEAERTGLAKKISARAAQVVESLGSETVH